MLPLHPLDRQREQQWLLYSTKCVLSQNFIFRHKIATKHLSLAIACALTCTHLALMYCVTYMLKVKATDGQQCYTGMASLILTVVLVSTLITFLNIIIFDRGFVLQFSISFVINLCTRMLTHIRYHTSKNLTPLTIQHPCTILFSRVSTFQQGLSDVYTIKLKEWIVYVWLKCYKYASKYFVKHIHI